MKKIDALAAAIAYINNFHDAESEAFQCANPGLVKADSLYHVEQQNKNGIRVFGSIQGGWRALVSDIENKCRGIHKRRNAVNIHLTPTDNLSKLLRTYGLGDEQAIAVVVGFMKTALGDPSFGSETRLEEIV